MATLLRFGMTVCLMILALPAFSADEPVRSSPPTPFSPSEACRSGPMTWGARRNTRSETVSVSSLLTPRKVERAFERAERDFVGNDLRNAEKEANTAIAIYPKSAVAWCLMGTLHEKQVQLDEASSDYTRALTIDSHLVPAYLGLARIAFRGHRWQEVVRFTDKVASLSPLGAPVAYLYNAAANFNQSNFAAAEISARRFQALDPEHERPQVYLLMGDILAAEGDYAGAVEQEKLYLRIVPNDYAARGIKVQINTWEGLRNRERASLAASGSN